MQDSRSYSVSHSYGSCYILTSPAVSAAFPTQSGLLGEQLPEAQCQQLCSLSGPVGLGRAGMGREELAALPFLTACCRAQSQPALFLAKL